MTGAPVARWSAPESLVSVEYSTVVLEHIREHVIEGFHRVLRGGVEVGGILFGNHDGKRVSVLAMRAVDIEYASGPVYLLSDKDKLRFSEVLDSYKTDRTLAGMLSVGWFVSHTRSLGVSMTARDEQLFSEFFPERWQITLVLRPGRMGIARAGFFTREADGGMKVDAPYREFELAPPFEHVALEAREEHRSAQAHAMAIAVGHKLGPVSVPPPAPPAEVKVEDPAMVAKAPTHTEAHTHSGRRWSWVTLALLLVLVAAGAWWFLYSPFKVRSGLGLFVLDRGGPDLEVEWRPKAVTEAETAVIELKEGDDSKLIPIKSREQLLKGFFPVKRKTGDVSVRFTAFDGQGKVTAQEVARFIGDPPVIPPSQELLDARAEIERLKAENARLQVSVELWTLRARQAEVRANQLQLESRNREGR